MIVKSKSQHTDHQISLLLSSCKLMQNTENSHRQKICGIVLSSMFSGEIKLEKLGNEQLTKMYNKSKFKQYVYFKIVIFLIFKNTASR